MDKENLKLIGKSKYIAFVDECGNHSLEKIDPDFPLFLLSCVVVERLNYSDQIIKAVNQFKLKYWDHEGVNLHSRDIRKADFSFSILQDTKVRNEFMTDMSSLLKGLKFHLFIVGIDKSKHKTRYAEKAQNPYELGFTFLFERLLYFLEMKNEVQMPVVAESRGRNEDIELEAAFYKLLNKGTYYNGASRFNKLSCRLIFCDKKQNITGLQLADLCAHPSARHVLKPEQPNQAYEIIKSFIFDEGVVKGWKIFP